MPDEQWQALKTQFGATDRQIVDMFVRPFLQEIAQRGVIAFDTDPRVEPESSMLGEQWRILRDEFGFVYDHISKQAVRRSPTDEAS